MPFTLSFYWCSPLQPHLLFKGVLIGVHISSHLTLSTDLSPKSILRALHPLLPTSFQLLPCFSISECFNAHGLDPFCNWRMYWSLSKCNMSLFGQAKSMKHSQDKQQRLEDTCRMGDTIPG